MALVSGAVLLFGWGLGIEALRRLVPGQPGMAITTAAGILGCALCIYATSATRLRRRFAFQRLLPLALLALAVFELVLLAVSPGRGLDLLLFDFQGPAGEIYMSPATAFCLGLAAVCFLLSPRRSRGLTSDLFGLALAIGFSITTLALTGYAFDSAALQNVFVFSAMSPQSAAVFFVTFLAIAAAYPSVSWVGLLTGPGPGGETLRRILPVVALGPFVLCWFTLLAVEAEVFDVNFRLSTLAISGAAGLTALVFWNAQRENADWRSLEASNRRLYKALSERDLLLREVYHRVKNNLQFVDAMLAMEASAGGAESERIAQIRRRLHALSLVHQQLMSAKDMATLHLRDFLEELCAHLAQGGGFDARGIELETDIVARPIDFDSAVSIGLIITELISNAAKYAFPDGRKGRIAVTGRMAGEDVLQLSVADDGVGHTGDATAGSTKMGHLILRSLVAQLSAELAVQVGEGYSVMLTVPLKQS